MLSSSISSTLAHATDHASARSLIRGARASRFFAVNFFESASPSIGRSGSRITAAAQTGPASGPRPASSTPAVRRGVSASSSAKRSGSATSTSIAGSVLRSVERAFVSMGETVEEEFEFGKRIERPARTERSPWGRVSRSEILSSAKPVDQRDAQREAISRITFAARFGVSAVRSSCRRAKRSSSSLRRVSFVIASSRA